MLADVASSTTVLDVYLPLVGPTEDRSCNIGPTPSDAVCPRDTYGDKAKPSVSSVTGGMLPKVDRVGDFRRWTLS